MRAHMTDVFSKQERSAIMRAVLSRDTVPEMTVRRALHRLGYRYRLHVSSLPGVPDLVFPSRGKVIFVHGCFWHRHRCGNGRSMPASNAAYWKEKFARNKARDRKNRSRLLQSGWQVLVLWECEIKRMPSILERLTAFLDASRDE